LGQASDAPPVEAPIDATSARQAITGGPAIILRCAGAIVPIRLGRQTIGGAVSQTNAIAERTALSHGQPSR